MRAGATLGLVAALALVPRLGRADPIAFGELAQGPEPVVEPQHWAREASRLFFSVRANLGYLYLKPRLSFGWGKPFSMWTGLDVVPVVTPNAAGGYAGWHVQLDWFEVRAGARLTHSFYREYLQPLPSYNLIDVGIDTHRGHDYLTLEAEASAAIPAGPGSILALFTAESIQFVPAGLYVFDETLHVVVSPPPVFRGRLGYSFELGKERVARLGFVGEIIEIPIAMRRSIAPGSSGRSASTTTSNSSRPCSCRCSGRTRSASSARTTRRSASGIAGPRATRTAAASASRARVPERDHVDSRREIAGGVGVGVESRCVASSSARVGSPLLQ